MDKEEVEKEEKYIGGIRGKGTRKKRKKKNREK